jgi:hypothetical protein
MSIAQATSVSIENAAWQDYRASNTAMVVFYATDPVSELPIREIPEELPTEILPEPNYETGTYGFYGCGKGKIRAAFVKSKLRYLLFVTKYAGTNADYKDRYFITGLYHVFKTADVKKIHIRYNADYSCLDEDACMALRADAVRFVAIEDAFEVGADVLKSWEYNARLTKQTRIILTADQTRAVVDHLMSKPDITPALIAETERLWPHAPEGGAAEEESEE